MDSSRFESLAFKAKVDLKSGIEKTYEWVFRKSYIGEKYFYITNIFPYYRKPIWELLLNEKTYNFHIYYSNQNLNGIKAVDDIKIKTSFN